MKLAFFKIMASGIVLFIYGELVNLEMFKIKSQPELGDETPPLDKGD